MNDHDRQNITFIRQLSKPELDKWVRSIYEFGDNDEIDYALKMLCSARNQIEMELLELIDTDANESVDAAAQYLKKFRLQ